jgi:hypothetical protein
LKALEVSSFAAGEHAWSGEGGRRRPRREVNSTSKKILRVSVKFC